MCTYLTERVAITARAKGTPGWLKVTDASVYFDHPAELPAEHSLNIDLLAPEKGPSARVAVELDPTAALGLARAVLEMLASAPQGLLPDDVAAAARAHLAGAMG